MKIEPKTGQEWRNKRNGTRITITGRTQHDRPRGDWDYSVRYVTERGYDGQSFYPNFHGRFELVADGSILPLIVALTKPLEEWPTDFLYRLTEEARRVIERRDD